MELKEAEELRCVRFYEWALAIMEHEVRNNFPLLSKTRSRDVFGTLLQVRNYPPKELEEVALLAVKRTHSRALEILGEQLSVEEVDLVNKKWKVIWRDRVPFNFTEFERQFLELAPGQIGMSRQFRARVVKNLTAYFGIESQKISATDFLYRDTIGDWNVETRCQLFGKEWKYFSYIHYIFRRDHDNLDPVLGNSHNPNPTRIINNGITDLAKLLGIGGGTGWSEIHGDEEENVIREIMTVLPAFYDRLPTLLDGLDIGS